MANKIQVKRGKEVNLPILDVGEPAFTTDTKKPFIGSDSGNIELATKEQINSLAVLAKPCSMLGMIANDNTKALENYNILLNAIKIGTKVIVDDVYYVQSPYNSASNDNLVNVDIFIIGNNKNKSKLISLGGWYFNAKGNVLISNITLDCQTSIMTYFINCVAPYYIKIDINNNYITGNIRMVHSDIPINYDFVNNVCGIEEIRIENNEFYDVYNSGGRRTIFSLADTLVKLSYIRNNNVTDFSYIFYNNGITNGNTATSYLSENNKKTYIENNKVICTDDYNAVVKNDGYKRVYYCFTLLESKDCECRNNVFEGIHIFDAIETVVYDNYFSVTNLIYENNVWKNIVNFTEGVVYNDIMKSKGGYGSLSRYYFKNQYIVEKEYADKFSMSRSYLKKEINTYQVTIDKVVIEDNYFDMYMLGFSYHGASFILDYVFNRNTIKSYCYIESAMTRNALVCINEKIVGSVKYPISKIFTNNIIVYENPPETDGIGSQSSIFECADSVGSLTKVIFKNNYIKFPMYYFIRGTAYSEIESNNNIIDSIDCKWVNPYTKLLTNPIKDLRVLTGTKFIKNITYAGIANYMLFGDWTTNPNSLPPVYEAEIDLTYTANVGRLQILNLWKLMDSATYTFKMRFEHSGKNYFYNYDINFTITNDGTNNIINCKGRDVRLGETVYISKNYVLDGSGIDYNNLYIEKENIVGTSPIDVNVSNPSNKESILFLNKSSNFINERIKLKITITKS